MKIKLTKTILFQCFLSIFLIKIFRSDSFGLEFVHQFSLHTEKCMEKKTFF